MKKFEACLSSPEWDLIQQKIGAINQKEANVDLAAVHGKIDGQDAYRLYRCKTVDETWQPVMTDLSMGLILDHLETVLEFGAESETTAQNLRDLTVLLPE